MKSSPSTLRIRCRATLVVCAWLAQPAPLLAQTASAPGDPADPAAAVPATRYESALPARAGTYLEPLDAPRTSWREVFGPGGRFVAESGQAPASPATPAGAAGSGSDARGVVRAVDRVRGEVTIAHGPIAKLGMPGMTMVFRARDPRLLDGVEPGDEVGFTAEMEDATLLVTGFQR